jgi:hypothetical protein
MLSMGERLQLVTDCAFSKLLYTKSQCARVAGLGGASETLGHI